jgi:1-deoxy-D-xylulose-5-phosphate reductoisomerase
LTFEEPDPARFPALRIAKESLRAGGAAPTVLNAANEVAVEAFLNRATSFPGIAALVERTLNKAASDLAGVVPDSLEAVMYLDTRAREIAKTLLLEQTGACAGPYAYSVPI